jgi:hypothetical protein
MREYDTEKIIETYLKYLNGPLGGGVMKHLLEGASFVVRAQHELIEVSKNHGKAVVRLVQENNTELDDLRNEIS